LPDTLKILVVDRISLYQKANEAREKMFAPDLTDEERFELNKINIESRLENQQIWDELNYFQEHGTELKKHWKFKQQIELEKLQALSRKELMLLLQNLPSARSKAHKAIKENPEDDEILLKKRILLRKYDWQEKEANKLMGIS
jgi:hypothetical protein